MSAVDVMYQPYSNNFHYYPRTAIEQTKLHDMMDRVCYPSSEVFVGSSTPTTTTSPTLTTTPPHHLHPHLPPHQQQITPLPPTTHHPQHPQATSLSIPSTTSHQQTATQHPHHTQTHQQPMSDMVTTSPGSSSHSRSNSAGIMGRGVVKEEDESCEDSLLRPVATHFLSNSSYLRIFVNSDFNHCVEDHFQRSLGSQQQPTTYRATGSPHSAGSSPDGNKTTRCSKDSVPMTHRKFPPSFWDPHAINPQCSNYQDSLQFSTSNPYLNSAALHGISSLHQVASASPWHYQLSPHSQGSYHRPSPAAHMHYDFSYSSMAAAAAAAASSRFGSAHGQYNPLIMPHHPVATATQPATAAAMRSASGHFNSMPGQHCDISGKSAADLPTTARRFVEYPSHTNLDPVLTGMDGHMQDTGKDMYWY